MPDEAIAWIQRSRKNFFMKLKIPVMFLMCLVCLATYFVARSYLRLPLFTTTVAIFLLLLGEESIKKMVKIDTKGIVVIIAITAILGFGWAFLAALLGNPTISGVTPMALLYLFVMGIIVILNPLSMIQNLFLVLFMVLYGSVMIGISGVQTTHDLTDGALILLGWHFFGLYTHHGWQKTAKRAALLTIKQMHLFQRSEQLKRDVLEKDLRLAQELQNSISQPTAIKSGAGIEGVIYQQKKGFLGGDWTSIHRDKNSNLYIIMADITGKGIPAALVVHALQALWVAGTSSVSPFDPVAWIHEVNKTMITLGQNSPQTLSIGIIVIEGSKLSYVCAGHVPLFIVTEKLGEIKLGTVASRGNLLGVTSDLKLSVRSVDLKTLNLRWILGGTDGVFRQGTRLSPREAKKILNLLLNTEIEQLLNKEHDDDKVLLLLERDVA